MTSKGPICIPKLKAQQNDARGGILGTIFLTAKKNTLTLSGINTQYGRKHAREQFP